MDYEVVLVPSFAQAEAWQKSHARMREGGVFAQTVTTYDEWIAGLWELYGDGRMLVSPAQRSALMQVAARTCPLPGAAALAAQCVRVAAGVPEFEEALTAVQQDDAPTRLSENEQAFLKVLVSYAALLASHRLVEPGNAAALLAQQEQQVFPRLISVLMSNAAPLTWQQAHFFAQCSHVQLQVQLAAGAQGAQSVAEQVKPQFACPAGRLAQPALIADLLEGHADEGPSVITCKNPLSLFNQVAPRLAEAGWDVCVQHITPFLQTDFGRAVSSCYRALHDEVWNPADLSDAVGSFFSGVNHSEAIQFDTQLRGNRIASREEELARVRASSELFSQLEELVSTPEADILLGVFEQYVRAAMHRSEAWRTQQLAAMKVFRTHTTAARAARATMEECMQILQRVSVPVALHYSAEQAGASQVLITTLQQTAKLQKGSYDSVVLADLTSDDYPVAERDDALSTFFGKLGLQPTDSAIAQARRAFRAALDAAESRVVLVRPLADDAGTPTYPAVVLEEFVDLYRANTSDINDIDNDYRLPEQLQEDLGLRGEEFLYANVRAEERTITQQVQQLPSRPDRALITPETAGDVIPKRKNSDGSEIQGIYSTPSQIEAYLECPYKWFAQRSMNIETVDEGFGPLEKGQFAHQAFETFYRRFQQLGYQKVGLQNLSQAQQLMEEVLDELCAQQYQMKPGRGRLVPQQPIEKRELEALCANLVHFLSYEAQLLPTFHPEYFEYKVNDPSLVDYAGGLLAGTVDRIDVDEKGRAVIIDYKGSLNPEYQVAGKQRDHAGKVQTRIYAQIIKQKLGLNVVGALYVSYGSKPAISGAFDSRELEVPHLPGISVKSCSCGRLQQPPSSPPPDYSLADLSFDALLDETEDIAAQAIQNMAAGKVEPQPSSEQACKWCPVLDCSKRGA